MNFPYIDDDEDDGYSSVDSYDWSDGEQVGGAEHTGAEAAEDVKLVEGADAEAESVVEHTEVAKETYKEEEKRKLEQFLQDLNKYLEDPTTPSKGPTWQRIMNYIDKEKEDIRKVLEQEPDSNHEYLSIDIDIDIEKLKNSKFQLVLEQLEQKTFDIDDFMNFQINCIQTDIRVRLESNKMPLIGGVLPKIKDKSKKTEQIITLKIDDLNKMININDHVSNLDNSLLHEGLDFVIFTSDPDNIHMVNVLERSHQGNDYVGHTSNPKFYTTNGSTNYDKDFNIWEKTQRQTTEPTDFVKFAGRIYFNQQDGTFESWTNHSGHFKPLASEAHITGIRMDKFFPNNSVHLIGREGSFETWFNEVKTKFGNILKLFNEQELESIWYGIMNNYDTMAPHKFSYFLKESMNIVNKLLENNCEVNGTFIDYVKKHIINTRSTHINIFRENYFNGFMNIIPFERILPSQDKQIIITNIEEELNKSENDTTYLELVLNNFRQKLIDMTTKKETGSVKMNNQTLLNEKNNEEVPNRELSGKEPNAIVSAANGNDSEKGNGNLTTSVREPDEERLANEVQQGEVKDGGNLATLHPNTEINHESASYNKYLYFKTELDNELYSRIMNDIFVIHVVGLNDDDELKKFIETVVNNIANSVSSSENIHKILIKCWECKGFKKLDNIEGDTTCEFKYEPKSFPRTPMNSDENRYIVLLFKDIFEDDSTYDKSSYVMTNFVNLDFKKDQERQIGSNPIISFDDLDNKNKLNNKCPYIMGDADGNASFARSCEF